MKIIVSVCFLLGAAAAAAAASGQLVKPQVLDAICKDKKQDTCQAKATECAEARRAMEISKTYVTIMSACAQEHNIDSALVKEAMNAVTRGNAGQIYDVIKLEPADIISMRMCGLRRGNMLDSEGKPNVVKIRRYLKLRIILTLSSNPELRSIMLDTLNSCPIVNDVNATDDFRYCQLNYCVTSLLNNESA
ncbi:uncharacterized protein [Procambarus clarkii]|uniref:uncharacterized protein n=1 Tax=Procambarus clarkii TaxID=6728 RepID=UPI001E67039F|nr:uncharacterized protein LOC123757157 [Procambarus clarkii]